MNEMNDKKNEQDTTPTEAASGGWSQFGAEPPRAGGFPGGRATEAAAAAEAAGQGRTTPLPVPPLGAPAGAPTGAPAGTPAPPVGAQPLGTPAGPSAPPATPSGVPAPPPAPVTTPVTAPVTVPAQRGRLSGMQKLGAGLALAAMAVGGGVAGAFAATALDDGPALVSSAAPVVSAAGNATTVADVAAAVQPAVVSIEVKTAAGGGEGSGVVLSADGLILTNNHVVGSAGQDGRVTVKFSDGRTAPARIVGTDPATDLAVIRAENVSGLTAASLGDSDRLKVGDSVLAIGSPLGLSGSVSAGIVSALDRTVTVGGEREQQLPPGWGGDRRRQSAAQVTTIGGAIQTDAAINPGNSGGALVNSSGQVIGINTAIATNGGDGSIGVGFAIPINTARQVADQLIETGKVVHAFLGVGLADATGDTAGALVSQVTDGSPAAQAGLRQGDVITKINDTAVEDGDTVVGVVRGLKPGDRVTLVYLRDGRSQTVTATLVQKTGE
ncbi:S1C family serine protease [Planomonospora parontospora]|uniref:S1C family serine protease n=1 Tax=Planomonospora parontospora TaxID=58119 RepID=UPI0019B67F30|nr:trypsin-like peptidase domain-containing protein [Planomonospora parontospora]GGL24920.1 peptidase S1 [Planomonospora parontospora subsp. antibiotica]GII16394.1 peptidase S1 [Planomonospora parontospora subsp. antibiotica]